MAQSILGSLSMGYELVWNQWRRCVAVRLFVEPHASGSVDAQHLLSTLSELWPLSAVILQISTPSLSLLNGLLDFSPQANIWIEVQEHWMVDAIFSGKVRAASARGVSLVWRGGPGQAPHDSLTERFRQFLREPTAQQALSALRVALRQQQDGGLGAATMQSPIVAGCLYTGLASQALVEHALDRQGVWAVAGWPNEEVLYGYRFRQIQPSRVCIESLLNAVDTDQSVDILEQRLGNDPLLAYRFLRFANSAAVGMRHEAQSLRQGLMAMGYSHLRKWLMEQLTHASSDPNLDPVRKSMVLRAHIMERLADAGVEEDLRREVFLCGILSQLDMLVGEPLGATVHRLPLPGRVNSAILGQTGPYAPYLDMAAALESGATGLIRDVGVALNMAPEDVNRALLRTLATL